MRRAIWIFLCSFLLGFHYAFIAYINSSFISRFVDNSTLNILYILGASFNILFFLSAPKAFRSMGIKTAAALVICIEFFAAFFISKSSNAYETMLCFLALESVGPLITYSMDLFLESSIRNEGSTGRMRSFVLTSMNVPYVASLLILPKLVHGSNFSKAYLVSSLMLIPVLFILSSKFKAKIDDSTIINFKEAKEFIKKDVDILRVLGTNMALQMFYGIMVIYMPLLLSKTLGFSWQQIAPMFVIMLLPFLIFQIPVGRVIDKRTGETEFIFIGLIIMAVACFMVPLTHVQSFWLWAAILFTSRIGAALVEISNESFFFKKVNEHHSGIISIFRMTAGAGYLLAPLMALIALHFVSYAGLFGILGLICILALSSIPKVDSR